VSDEVLGAPRVLVAEDDPDVHVLIQLLLESAGYHVTMVRDGVSAVEWVEGPQDVDLVILDVAMPGKLDGLEVTRRLRRSPGLEQVPILLLSARSKGESVQEGLAAGADDYVVKPFDSDILLSRIASVLDSR
jgi:DNA-binding response OmpR family regulator